MAMGKVVIGDIAPQKPLITKISTHYSIHHDNDLTPPKSGRYQEVVRYPVLAVTRPSKSVRQNLVGITLGETPVRIVKSSKSERLRTSQSKSSETTRSLPETLSRTRSKGKLKQPSPPVLFTSTPSRGHTMPLIVNKPTTISGFERDFWTYWKSVKTGDIHPDDACTDVDRKSVQAVQRDSSTDSNISVDSRLNYNSPSTSPDPDKLSIKNIFSFLNTSDMNAANKNRNSLERVRLLQKSVRKRGNTLTTVEMALKNARRYRHPEKPEAGLPAVRKSHDDLGPIVNSPLLKDNLQNHMSQPAMPVEKAVKHHSFTYVSKQRSRRIREVFVAKKTSPHGKSNVPQSRTLAVFSRQVPEMTEDSLEAALSHRTATVHDTGRGAGYWVEGRKHRTQYSQHDVTDDKGSSTVVHLPKVRLDPDDPDDIINGVALVNFSKITEKMNNLDIAKDKGSIENEETGLSVESAEYPAFNSNVVKGRKKQVNIHLPSTL